jgi:hypothetical protein
MNRSEAVAEPRISAIVPPETWRIVEHAGGTPDCFIPMNRSPRSIALLRDAAERMTSDEPDTEEDLIRWAEMEDQ